MRKTSFHVSWSCSAKWWHARWWYAMSCYAMSNNAMSCYAMPDNAMSYLHAMPCCCFCRSGGARVERRGRGWSARGRRWIGGRSGRPLTCSVRSRWAVIAPCVGMFILSCGTSTCMIMQYHMPANQRLGNRYLRTDPKYNGTPQQCQGPRVMGTQTGFAVQITVVV